MEVKYEEVGSSMRGMSRLRRIAASSWAGGEWARAGWVEMLFSARWTALTSFRCCGPFTYTSYQKSVSTIRPEI